LAGGQEDLKGKIFRIGHLGYCSETDIMVSLDAISKCL
ncbi:MAG: aminotransferase, partial [Elusimicrobia bacterium CG06_land_8_20_14_3_00_38_11]